MADEYSEDYAYQTNGEDQQQDFTQVDETGAENFESHEAGESQITQMATDSTPPVDHINASKNDNDERKIFVGGLSWETTVKDLREYFEKFGKVMDCNLKTDPTTNRSRGFGFVMFEDASSVDHVLSEGTHTLHGRNIDPKRAKARGSKEPVLKIFVGGVDPSLPEETIRSHFEKYGKVTEVDLPFDKMKNTRRGFCFVSFESEEVTDAACVEAKQEIAEGKTVDVRKATPKNDRQGGAGGRGGRGGFRGGRGGGRGGGGYNQGDWGGYDYSGYYGGNQGYDYSGYYGYGNYDYSGYYNNQGWGNYNYNQGYDNTQYSGQNGGTGGRGGGKAKAVGSSNGASNSYHPYNR